MNELQQLDWAALSERVQVEGLQFGINLLAAVAIFVIGRIVVRLIVRGLRRLMTARTVDPILESFLGNIVSWALMTFVIIAAITQIGIPTTSLIALIGAAGLAVGLAMQGSLANFAAGVLIVMFRPYRTGDWVEVAGTSGAVVEVQILTTILTSADNKRIIVPNGQIMSSIITNYSTNPTRRIDLEFGVGYEDDLETVKSTLRELVDAEPRILKEPECQIALNTLGESTVNVICRPWVNSSDYWSVYFDLTAAVKKRFDDEKISFPFPQRVVHTVSTDA